MCSHHCSTVPGKAEATHHGSLDKNINISSFSDERERNKKHKSLIHRRELRKVLVSVFGPHSKFDDCLRYCSSDENGVSLVNDGGRVRWKNRWACHNRSCVWCGQIRSIENARKTSEILAHPDLENASALFVTLTSKRIVQGLDEGLKVASRMRTKLNNSLRTSKKYPVLGAVTSVEWTLRLHDLACTPHNHILYFLDNEELKERHPGVPLQDILEKVGAYIKRRWVSIAEKEGVYAAESAQDVQVISHEDRPKLSQYLNKFSLELASPNTKKARISGNYTFGDLLNAYHEEPTPQLRRAIIQTTVGLKNKRTFQISHKLRQYLTPEAEEGLEEPVEVEKVPVSVFMRLTESEVADTLTDVMNGFYAYRDDADHIEAIFRYFCSIFRSGWENQSHRKSLKDFASRLSDLKRPPDKQVEDFRFFSMT